MKDIIAWNEIEEDLKKEMKLKLLEEKINVGMVGNFQGINDFIDTASIYGIRDIPFNLGDSKIGISIVDRYSILMHYPENEKDDISGYSSISEAIIAIFDMADEESYIEIQNLISSSIDLKGKMLPIYLLGLYTEKPAVRYQDIRRYATNLGDVSVHIVPFREMGYYNYDDVYMILHDIVEMITCPNKWICAGRCSSRRNYCQIRPFVKNNSMIRLRT